MEDLKYQVLKQLVAYKVVQPAKKETKAFFQICQTLHQATK
jgi:hypothetical protein